MQHSLLAYESRLHGKPLRHLRGLLLHDVLFDNEEREPWIFRENAKKEIVKGIR